MNFRGYFNRVGLCDTSLWRTPSAGQAGRRSRCYALAKMTRSVIPETAKRLPTRRTAGVLQIFDALFQGRLPDSTSRQKSYPGVAIFRRPSRGWDCGARPCAARRPKSLPAILSNPVVSNLPPIQPDTKKAPGGAFFVSGGEGGIRTHGTPKRTTDFESAPFDHSGTSPLGRRMLASLCPEFYLFFAEFTRIRAANGACLLLLPATESVSADLRRDRDILGDIIFFGIR